MKIRWTRRPHHVDQVVDVDQEVAKFWMDKGDAVPVGDRKGETETAEMRAEAKETRSSPPSKAKTKAKKKTSTKGT